MSRIASASKSVVISLTFGAGGKFLKGLRQLKSGATLIGPPLAAARIAVEEKVRGAGAEAATVTGALRCCTKLTGRCNCQLAAECRLAAHRFVERDVDENDIVLQRQLAASVLARRRIDVEI